MRLKMYLKIGSAAFLRQGCASLTPHVTDTILHCSAFWKEMGGSWSSVFLYCEKIQIGNP